MCRSGYNGLKCESLANVCESSPCQNDGVCIQLGNQFDCNCTGSHQGERCEDIVLPAITSNSTGINSGEIYAIAGAATAVILIVLIFVLVRVWRRQKRNRRRGNVTAGIANDGTEVYLNLLKSDKHNYSVENTFKVENNSKHKVPPSPRPPPVPDRPASYTPSAHTDSINALNNFDALRNYGTAADELERDNISNIPPYNAEFLQTFSPPRAVASIPPILLPPPTSCHSDTDSLQKEGWEAACQNILQNYVSDKHSDKMSKLMPVGTVMPMSHLQGREDNTSVSSLPSESDDDLPEPGPYQ